MDPLGLIGIFAARILDVSCGTIRILLLVKGRRLQAAFMGFCEVSVYMLVLGYILGGGGTLTLPQLLAYAAGYASGNYVGAMLEEKLMNSFVMLDIISEWKDETFRLIDTLRQEGFGATVLDGMGKNGMRLVIKVVCRRNDIPRLSAVIGKDKCVFVSDVRSCWGGRFPLRRGLTVRK